MASVSSAIVICIFGAGRANIPRPRPTAGRRGGAEAHLA